MRKLVVLILIFSFCLSMVACGSEQKVEIPSTEPVAEDTAAPKIEEKAQPEETEPVETAPVEEEPVLTEPILQEVTISESIIFENDNYKATITGFNDSDSYEAKIKVHLENFTDKNIVLTANHFVVNGIYMWCDLYIKAAAGKNAKGYIGVRREDMEEFGITQIATMYTNDASFVDTDSYDTLDEFEFEVMTSIADDYVQEIDDSGSLVYSEDGIEIKYKGHRVNDYGEVELMFYMKNGTDRDLIISCDNVSVNDYTVYGDLLARCNAGSVCYALMDFYEDDLVENDIEKIETVSFTFEMYEQKTYDSYRDTDFVDLIIE